MTVLQGKNMLYCFPSSVNFLVSNTTGSLTLHGVHWTAPGRQNYPREVNQCQKARFIWYKKHDRGAGKLSAHPSLVISMVWNNRLPVIGFSLLLIRELFWTPWMPLEGVGRHVCAWGFLRPMEKIPQRHSQSLDPPRMLQAALQRSTYKKCTIATPNYNVTGFV